MPFYFIKSRKLNQLVSSHHCQYTVGDVQDIDNSMKISCGMATITKHIARFNSSIDRGRWLNTINF